MTYLVMALLVGLLPIPEAEVRGGFDFRPDRFQLNSRDVAEADLLHMDIEICTITIRDKAALDSVLNDPFLHSVFSDEMLPAIEAAGDPAVRLAALSDAVVTTRRKLEESGTAIDESSFGLSVVEIEVKLSFFWILAGKIASSDHVGKPRRKKALRSLMTLIDEPYPVGFKATTEENPWSQGAAVQARQNVEMYLEILGTADWD